MAKTQKWDWIKNEILPSQVTAMSNKAAWWVCTEGHSWNAEVARRSAGSGCPYCDNQRVLEGFNDLRTLRPDLALQWDQEKTYLRHLRLWPVQGNQRGGNATMGILGEHRYYPEADLTALIAHIAQINVLSVGSTTCKL